MPKRIYIDFDDVISRTAEIILDLVKDKYQITADFNSITDFNLQNSFDLTDEQFTTLIDLIHEPDVIKNMLPIKGALEGIDNLKSKGHEIAIVTGRPPSTKNDSIKWLKKHNVPFDSITFVDKYGRFLYNNTDTDCISLDELKTKTYDFAIEDSATMAVYLATEMKLKVLLHDRPWNKHVVTDNGLPIYRCFNWDDILEKISK